MTSHRGKKSIDLQRMGKGDCMEKEFGKDFRMDAERMGDLLEKHDFKQLKEELESMHPVDIVDAFEELDKKQRTLVFRLLAKEEAAEVFTDMNSDMREDLINALTDSELEEVMDEMYVDEPWTSWKKCRRMWWIVFSWLRTKIQGRRSTHFFSIRRTARAVS